MRMTILRRALLRGLGGAALAMTGRQAGAADAVEVKIDNFTFTPKEITIPKGGSVHWVNHDDIPHSVLIPTLNYRSKVLDTDGGVTARFDKPGSYDYVCGLHPHMKGKLRVTG